MPQLARTARRHAFRSLGAVGLTFFAMTAAAQSQENVARDFARAALRRDGNVERGRELFLNEALTRCTVCHRAGNRGGEIGPDLSAIGGKFDRPHLIESLLAPSAQIVEGYRSSSVLTADGSILTGFIKTRDDTSITLFDNAGTQHRIERRNIVRIEDNELSIMPTGLSDQLSEQQFVDLVAYLESLRPGKEKMGAAVRGPIDIPEAFVVETVATGLTGATAMDVLPDGRVLVCEQTGTVRMVTDESLLPQPVLTLPVEAYWERGLIGVTHHPEFPTQPFIYVCWVARSPFPHHRISRFTLNGNVADPASERLLLSGDDQRTLGGHVPAGHQGGALHFGPDGMLYIGIGENTAATPSQQLDTLQGKLLRIAPDGSLPADNPFFQTTTGKYRSIWARGLRNPFTFAFRPSDGLLLINDVGGKFEEINVGRAGANYGWPVVEHGPQSERPEFEDAIHWYPQSSLNGGDFSSQPAGWPEAYHHRYFFADFVQGWIKSIDPTKPDEATTFATGLRRPVDLRFAPAGHLYVLLRNAWVIDDKFEGHTGSLLSIHPGR